MKSIAVVGILVLIAAAAAAQETAYITDDLQIGLHQAADTSDSPFRNLASGTEITVLERVSDFARVRTADGDEGWVRAAFIVGEKPARLRAVEAETRSAELEQQLALAIAERDAANSEAREIVATAELDLAAARSARESLAQLRAENLGYEARIELYRGAIPWPWVLGAVIVALGAGFVGGWWWLDASIRRRYGGFKMY